MSVACAALIANSPGPDTPVSVRHISRPGKATPAGRTLKEGGQ